MRWLGNNRKTKQIAILVRASQGDRQRCVLRCRHRLIICYRRIIDVQNGNHKTLFKIEFTLVSRSDANRVAALSLIIKYSR